jgi:alpha-galactosidase
MKPTKIVVIGAGSASFGLTNLGAILRTPELKGSELCLVDIKKDGLEHITKLAERINREWNSEFIIKSSTDRIDMLEDADFVILSVAIDREKCWKIDQDIPKKYGIMHYAENAGPGGMMHAARNIALIMPILKDIEKLCLNAYVLNFTNPVPRICIAAARYTKVKMIGICHQIEFAYIILGKVLGKDLGFDVPEDYLFRWNDYTWKYYGYIVEQVKNRIELQAAGINHFTWMLSMKDKQTGEDLYPLFKERYLGGFEEFEPLTREVFDIFKFCPVPGDSHMVEYLPYTHNMHTNTWDKYDIQMYPLESSANDRNKMWDDIKEMAEGTKSIDHLRKVHTERSELIMAGIVSNQGEYEPAINIPNHGYIENLPYNAIVEVPGIINSQGANGVIIGKLPDPVAELCRRQITLAELVVEAAVKGDRDIALQALALDPMVDDPKIAKDILNDYLEAEKEYLPQFFGKNLL